MNGTLIFSLLAFDVRPVRKFLFENFLKIIKCLSGVILTTYKVSIFKEVDPFEKYFQKFLFYLSNKLVLIEIWHYILQII